MVREEARRRFRELWSEIRSLEGAIQLLEWDQETCMPRRGAASRAETLGVLTAQRHERLASDELWEVVAAVDGEDDGEWGGQQREATRQIRRARRVPPELARALGVARSRGLDAWQRARHEGSVDPFVGPLTELVDLEREEADCLVEGGSRYDALLDEYEPGVTESGLAPLFDDLRSAIGPLVEEIASDGRPVDESPALGHFPLADQERLGRWVIREIGFDFEAGRLDRSAHPFCAGIHRRDVRLTWRGEERDFRPALLGFLHETGHGLYEQNLPEPWEGTPLGEPASLGIHETQARLWEVLVGRSRAFWTWLLPRFRRTFGRSELTVNGIYPALHVVRPSLVRVEADAVTYNLHIVLRFELERALIAGDLEVPDLPGAWDDLSEEIVGVRPTDPVDGVLQDLHWAAGMFGYFPTYTLGTLGACQLFAAARRDLGDLEGAISVGDFGPLTGWLAERIHSRGRMLPPFELIEEATDRPLSAEAFVAFIRSLASDVYGV